MENLESQSLELNITRNIPASRERTFVAWLDPYDMKCFMTPGVGVSVTAVDNNPVEGGHFLVEMLAEGQTLPHRGEYKIINRPSRLAFTWDSAFSAPGSLVQIDFKEVSPDETQVTLHHQCFTDRESRDRHEEGWSNILKRLEDYLST